MPNLDVDRLIAGWRGPLLAALIALIAGLPAVFSLPPLDRDEARFAQATAQMFEADDFIRISFQDEPRNKKPIGIHWLQAASVGLFSSEEDREIWAYRLPSLLGAMVAAFACAWGAIAFFGQRAGTIAGITLASTFMLSTEASWAKTDAVLCGAITLAMAALGRLYLASKGGPHAGRRIKLVFWIAMAVAILDKGPIGPMVAGLTLVALALWDRDLGWIKRLSWIWGLLIVVAVVGPWAMAITVTEPGFWMAAVKGDLVSKVGGGQEGHGAFPGTHTLLTPLLFFPGTLLIGAAAVTAWTRRMEPGVRFAIAWLIPAWLVFELAPTKLPHYTLPLYGALAWLVAAAVTQPIGTRARWTGIGLSAVTVLLVSAVAVVGLRKFGDGGDVVWVSLTVGFAVIGLAVAAYFMLHKESVTALMILCGCAVIAHAALWAGLVPNLKPLWVSRNIARTLDRQGMDPRNGITPGPVEIYGYAEPSAVFLLGTETHFGDAGDAAEAVVERRPVLVEAKNEPAFRAELAERRLSVAPVSVIKGFNYSHGKPVTLTLYRNAAPMPAQAPAAAP